MKVSTKFVSKIFSFISNGKKIFRDIGAEFWSIHFLDERFSAYLRTTQISDEKSTIFVHDVINTSTQFFQCLLLDLESNGCFGFVAATCCCHAKGH